MKTSYLSPTAWLSEASRDGLGNRFWIDTRLLSVKVKCPDPGVASHDQKPDSGDSLRHQIPTPCPHSPPPNPHGIYIDRCIIYWTCSHNARRQVIGSWRRAMKHGPCIILHRSNLYWNRLYKVYLRIFLIDSDIQRKKTKRCSRSYGILQALLFTSKYRLQIWRCVFSICEAKTA